MKENKKVIYLAGGCFWGIEEFFRRINGVVDTISGYANGKTIYTNYAKLKETDHSETVMIEYDANKIKLDKILDYFFLIIDPLSIDKQGEDKGRQYRTGIYYKEKEDLDIIKNKIKEEQKKYDDKIVVEVQELKHFIIAEDYHQDYLQKNPKGYCHIDMNLVNKI